MKWYCNFIENLPYVRKFLHIFWVGNLVNINFWPLTLTVFIDFDGCWIMLLKNTPFFRYFSFLKFPENLKNLWISVFFLAVLKSSGKTGGTGPQLSGATQNYLTCKIFDMQQPLLMTHQMLKETYTIYCSYHCHLIYSMVDFQ